MIKHTYTGKLIAIDGPNGVGKTTIIRELETILNQKGMSVYITKEPSNSELGEFIRNYSEQSDGCELACLVAADRYYHIENEIVPKLEQGYIVITDRYILSSLILQSMDGVDSEFIININGKTILPDLQVSVFAKAETIQKRLTERDSLTRFEKGNRSEEELNYQCKGVELLKKIGVTILEINNDLSLNENVSILGKEVLSMIGGVHHG